MNAADEKALRSKLKRQARKMFGEIDSFYAKGWITREFNKAMGIAPARKKTAGMADAATTDSLPAQTAVITEEAPQHEDLSVPDEADNRVPDTAAAVVAAQPQIVPIIVQPMPAGTAPPSEDMNDVVRTQIRSAREAQAAALEAQRAALEMGGSYMRSMREEARSIERRQRVQRPAAGVPERIPAGKELELDGLGAIDRSKLKHVPIVEMHGTMITATGNFATWRRRAREHGRQLMGTSIVNEKTGWQIRFNSNGINHVTGAVESQYDAIHYEQMRMLPTIIRKALLVTTEPDKSNEGRNCYTFYTIVDWEGTYYLMRIRVREDHHGRKFYHSQEEERLKKDVGMPGSVPGWPDEPLPPSASKHADTHDGDERESKSTRTSSSKQVRDTDSLSGIDDIHDAPTSEEVSPDVDVVADPELDPGRPDPESYERILKPTSIDEVMRATPPQILSLSGRMKPFLGTLLLHFRMLLWGDAGSGKSSLLLLIADELARTSPVLYYMTEEKISTGRLQRRLQLMKVYNRNIRFVDDTSFSRLVDLANSGQYRFIIIDSIKKLDVPYSELEKLVEQFPEIAFVLVAQTDKTRRDYSGPAELDHFVDTVIHTENVDDVAVAHLVKHRDGALTRFNIFGKENSSYRSNSFKPSWGRR